MRFCKSHKIEYEKTQNNIVPRLILFNMTTLMRQSCSRHINENLLKSHHLWLLVSLVLIICSIGQCTDFVVADSNNDSNVHLDERGHNYDLIQPEADIKDIKFEFDGFANQLGGELFQMQKNGTTDSTPKDSTTRSPGDTTPIGTGGTNKNVTNAPGPQPTNSDPPKSNSIYYIIGGVVGLILLIILAAIIYMYCCAASGDPVPEDGQLEGEGGEAPAESQAASPSQMNGNPSGMPPGSGTASQQPTSMMRSSVAAGGASRSSFKHGKHHKKRHSSQGSRSSPGSSPSSGFQRRMSRPAIMPVTSYVNLPRQKGLKMPPKRFPKLPKGRV